MSLTYVTSNLVLDVLTRVTASLARPAALYAALFSTAPTKSTPGVEFTTVVAASYTRCAVTFGAAVNGIAASTVACGFPSAAGVPTDLTGAPSPWPPALAVGIFDASTAGTLWYYELLPTKPVVVNNTHVAFAIGALKLTLDS